MSAKKVVGAIFSMVFRLVITLCVLYAIYRLAIGAYNFGYRVFADIPAALSPGTDVEVTITETMDSKEIAQNFEDLGLVENWKLFWTQIQFSEYKDEIRPGVYTLNTSMKAEEMLETISTDPEAEQEE